MYIYFYLFLSAVFILLLCFTKKEGFYSNQNIYSANSEINKLKIKAKSMQTTMNKFVEQKINTADVISKLYPILETDKPSLYQIRVVQTIHSIIGELSTLEEEGQKINDHLIRIKNSDIEIFGNKLTLSRAIDEYLSTLETISKKLTQIPDK